MAPCEDHEPAPDLDLGSEHGDAIADQRIAARDAVAIGVAAGVLQMTMNVRPSPRIAGERQRAAAAGSAQPV